MSANRERLAVAICTRNRLDQLRRTLAALDAQTRSGFSITVVDQSDDPDPELVRRGGEDARFELIHDSGRGLSRARNLAWRSLDAEWVAFVDDDCVPAEDWLEQLERALDVHPEASFVSGYVDGGELPSDDYLPVTLSKVEERLVRGRWTWPWKLGFGVCMAIRRDKIAELGGWDERLGPGVPDFPAADDMDFNYRLLRAGGVAYTTPKVRALHEQWRDRAELGPLYRGYMAAWCGFSMKQLRTGDLRGGAWLWSLGVLDVTRMLVSSLRRRSAFRLRITGWKLRGLFYGTGKGLVKDW
jgi:GT2 family glycosyltransferase